MLYPCPCCGYLTIHEQPLGTYEICDLCNWEDDLNQETSGGANGISLADAKKTMKFMVQLLKTLYPRLESLLPMKYLDKVVVNPKTGKIVSTNPLSRKGAHK